MDSVQHLKKVSYQHLPVIDLILQNPSWTIRKLAEATGIEYNWLCRVVRSDAFAARLVDRKNELLGAAGVKEVQQALRALTIQSVEVIQKKIDDGKLGDLALIKAFEVAAVSFRG